MDRNEPVFSGANGGAVNTPQRLRRRVNPLHAGVKVYKRKRATGTVWLARWIDPDRGRETEASLTKLRIKGKAERTAWAIGKAEEIAERRKAILGGAPKRDFTSIIDAVQLYYASVDVDLRPSTVRNYKETTNRFVRWAQDSGVHCLADLTVQRVSQFRDFWVHQTARDSAKGKGLGRGARIDRQRRRSAHSVNKAIRTIRTLLNWFRRRSMVPHLNSDVIADALPFLKTKKSDPRFLSRPETQQLLAACVRHDSEMFAMTRDEKKRQGVSGSTPRYDPVLPFVLFMLLTGMRFGEGAELMFQAIDFESEQICLEAERTKTQTSRRIDLRITPLLKQLLRKWRLQAGGMPFVFGGSKPISRGTWEAARKRLINDYDAPKFSWHDLRRTSETFLVCAPNIYGAASGFLAAKRLGHSMEVSERHYLGLVRDIPMDVCTLEAALGVEGEMNRLVGGDQPQQPSALATA